MPTSSISQTSVHRAWRLLSVNLVLLGALPCVMACSDANGEASGSGGSVTNDATAGATSTSGGSASAGTTGATTSGTTTGATTTSGTTTTGVATSGGTTSGNCMDLGVQLADVAEGSAVAEVIGSEWSPIHGIHTAGDDVYILTRSGLYAIVDEGTTVNVLSEFDAGSSIFTPTVIDATHMYYGSVESVSRIGLSGGDPELVFDESGAGYGAQHIALDGDNLIMFSGSSRELISVPKAGGAKSVLLSDIDADVLAVTNGTIYLGIFPELNLVSIPATGGEVTTLVTSPEFFQSMDASGTTLVWGENSEINWIDTSDPMTVNSSGFTADLTGYPKSVKIVGDRVYSADHSLGWLALDASGCGIIAHGVPSGIVYDYGITTNYAYLATRQVQPGVDVVRVALQ